MKSDFGVPRIADVSDIDALEKHSLVDLLPATSMYGLIERSAKLFGPKPALTFLPDGNLEAPYEVTTYRQLFENVTRAANLFHSLGAGANDTIAILAPNIPETHFALWGAETVGRACPINVLLDAQHVAELVKASGAKILVALGPDAELPIWSRVKDLQTETDVITILIVGKDLPSGPGVRSFSRALADQPADRLLFKRDLNSETPAALFHTGGTTALPKLAQHTHGNQVHTSWSASLYYALSPEDVVLHGFPLFHVAGSFVYGSSCFVAGASQLLPTRTGWRNQAFMRNVWHFVKKHRVSVIGCVPTLLASLMKIEIEENELDSVRLFLTGGSPLPGELATAFERKYCRPVRNILGMTESAGLVTVEPFHGPRTPGSTGLRLPFTQVRAVRQGLGDAAVGSICKPNETGVIVLKGPNVSPGYTDPARDRGTFEDGWLISGDLGHVDEGGHVFVTGRAKDVIIRGAHNIDPTVIEEVICRHPAVELCAAVGQPDPYAGELPIAFVTLKAGAKATPEEIAIFTEPLIPEPPARPKRISIVEAMPLTAIGKIYKPALRRIAAEWAFTAALAPLGQPSDISVESIDRNGAPMILIVCLTSDNTFNEKIRACLRDFVVPYEIVVNEEGRKVVS